MRDYIRMTALAALVIGACATASAEDKTPKFGFSDLPLPEATRVAAPSLYDAFVTGETSPLGAKVDSVSPDDLGRHAEEYLKGGNANPAEAAFWLKRTVAATSEGVKVRAWALVQLGILTYDRNTPESHALARQLWELAGAWGQPDALCFLGQLAEEGDDMPTPDLAKAIVWYTRANAAGCDKAGPALARLKP